MTEWNYLNQILGEATDSDPEEIERRAEEFTIGPLNRAEWEYIEDEQHDDIVDAARFWLHAREGVFSDHADPDSVWGTSVAVSMDESPDWSDEEVEEFIAGFDPDGRWYGTPRLTPTLRKLALFEHMMEKHNEMMRSQLSETLEEMIAEEFDEEVTVTFGGDDNE